MSEENITLESIHINQNDGLDLIPKVTLDTDTGICELSGDSMLENTEVFYAKIYDWVLKYIEHIKKPLQFNFKMHYFNTASSQQILFLLKRLKEYENNGGKIEVNWYYIKGDIDMYEEGKDYIKDTKIDINLIDYTIE